MRSCPVLFVAVTAAVLGCGDPPGACLLTADGRAVPAASFPVGAAVDLGAWTWDGYECGGPRLRADRWASSAPRVVAVDGRGRVRALAPGSAEVAAQVGPCAGRLRLTVVPAVARLEIRPADTTLTAGDTAVFRATAYGADGRVVAGAVAAMAVREDRASWRASGEVGVGLGPADPPPGRGHAAQNALPVRARRAAAGWVVAEVVGRRDSVRVRAAAP